MLPLTRPFQRFGLSYTTFDYSDLKLSQVEANADASTFAVEATMVVTNTGSIQGSEAVQLYIDLPESGVTHPKLQLKAFAKVRDLAPGSSETVKLHLDKYAVSFWDTEHSRWTAQKGAYRVVVGASSADLKLESQFTLDKSFTWTGL